ncbi:pseudouridine synthase [Candidatus Symbiobacter mobilis]|uniref:Pseudouridine synthase n=1 Tax=Candidatus Symbiobacter mobilis CR TaxID=946483 RepID=U5N9T6_9BURK|nr:pseudouridine synthase [Candidatus Symbiobacter mobilis]AGX88080.1 ribosomal large subunit pseudouridine synthase B [Candidatus Symbiobacter mobilis CR]
MRPFRSAPDRRRGPNPPSPPHSNHPGQRPPMAARGVPRGARPATASTRSAPAPSARPSSPPSSRPRNAPAPTATPKLHKALAQAGLGSRLDIEALIAQQRVTVNGQPAHIGQRTSAGDRIRVDGRPVRAVLVPSAVRVLLYHKPTGEIVSHDDPQHRPTVFQNLPRLPGGKWQSIGRLDINTEGLLLLTNSGELANRLAHPRYALEREYAVRVLGSLSAEERQRLRDGVPLSDGPARFDLVEEAGASGVNCWYRVVLREGRNREVRRIFEAVGRTVSRLIRVRYGSVLLPRWLRRGASVELDEVDIEALLHPTHHAYPSSHPPSHPPSSHSSPQPSPHPPQRPPNQGRNGGGHQRPVPQAARPAPATPAAPGSPSAGRRVLSPVAARRGPSPTAGSRRNAPLRATGPRPPRRPPASGFRNRPGS